MAIRIIMLSFLLSSCAGGVRLVQKECIRSDARLAEDQNAFRVDKKFSQKVWSMGSGESSASEVNLKEVLEGEDINCQNVKYIRYSIGQNFWDQIFSIVPFIQRSHVDYEVMLNNEDES